MRARLRIWAGDGGLDVAHPLVHRFRVTVRAEVVVDVGAVLVEVGAQVGELLGERFVRFPGPLVERVQQHPAGRPDRPDDHPDSGEDAGEVGQRFGHGREERGETGQRDAPVLARLWATEGGEWSVAEDGERRRPDLDGDVDLDDQDR